MTFKEALELGADFMDMNNPGVVYCIQDYVRIKRFGLPVLAGGIVVKDCMTGEELGVVEEKTLEEMYGDINKLLGIEE